MFRARLALAVLTAAVLLLPARAPAQELADSSLKQAAAKLAKSIRQAAAKEDGTTEESVQVSLGFFVPAGPDDPSTGGAIASELALALGSAVKKDAAITVKGEYSLVAKNGEKSLQIRVTMTKNTGGVVANITVNNDVETVQKVSDLAKIIGPTGKLDDDKDPVEQVINLAKKPTGVGKETLAFPTNGSKFAVEIRTKPKTTPDAAAEAKPVTVKAGQPEVDIAQGELYEVRVLNHGSAEGAFTLAIDGLDQFTFSDDRAKDGRPAFRHVLVPAAKNGMPGETIIRGWHKKFDEAAREHHHLKFLVTKYGEGASAAPKFPTTPLPQGKVGIIEVTFSLSFPPGTTRSGSETGFGPPGKDAGDVVKRVIDPPSEFLTIRYLRP